MHSENGVEIDFEEINRMVESADVFVVGFGGFPDRLLVDKRCNAAELPLVQVVEPLSSPRERLKWLARRRPSLSEPEAFTFIPWPHSTGFLADSGVWQRICCSAAADTDVDIGTQVELAFQDLQNLERNASMAILVGEGCLTLWPRDSEFS